MKKFLLMAGLYLFSTSVFAIGSCLCYNVKGDTQHVYNTCTDSFTSDGTSHGIPTPLSNYQSLGTSVPTSNGTNGVVGTCPYVNGGCNGVDCQDTLTDSATFDFHLQAGGLNTDLYVCEVGWNAHLCKGSNCNNNDDYMEIYNGANPAVKKFSLKSGTTDQSKTFTLADDIKFAKVFFNSINFGAGWYVKYCLDVKRLTVGSGIPYANDANSNNGNYALTDLLGTVTGTLVITPGKYMGVSTNAMDYFGIANLAYTVEHACGSSLQQIPLNEGGNPVNYAAWDELVDHSETANTTGSFCINGAPGCQVKTCVWKVSFRETQTCIRPLKNAQICPGPTCAPYEGTISTSLSTSTKFSCAEGSCD